MLATGLMTPAALAPFAVPAWSAAAATTMYVAAGGSNAGNTCTSPATPCATISYALTQGGAGSTVNVSGTILDRVAVSYPVTITGVNAPVGSPGMVDGSAGGPVFSTHSDLNIDHLTIRNGVAIDTVGGGGVQVLGGTTRLTNVMVTANTSTGRGGGVSSLSAVVITNSTISGNQADDGGGVYVSNGGTAQVTGSTISGNSAGTRGGGIQVGSSSSLQVSNSTLIAAPPWRKSSDCSSSCQPPPWPVRP